MKMRSIKRVASACVFFFATFNVHAAVLHFAGDLTVYIANTPQETVAATGLVDFDTVSGVGAGGEITSDVIPAFSTEATLTDIMISARGGGLFDVLFELWAGSSWLGNNAIIWELTENGDGTLNAETTDENGVDIADAIAAGTVPFLKTRIALDGTLAPVPLPAGLWLFGSALIGMIGIARRKKAV
jgi:hypothetical protein